MRIQSIDGQLFLDPPGLHRLAGLNNWSCGGASGTYNPATETVTSCVRKDTTDGTSVNGMLTLNRLAQTWSANFPPPQHMNDTFQVKVTSTANSVTSPTFTCNPGAMPHASASSGPDLQISFLKGSLIADGDDSTDELTADDFVCTGAGGTYDPSSEAVTDCIVKNVPTGEQTSAVQLTQDPATGQWSADFPFPFQAYELCLTVQTTQRTLEIPVSVEDSVAAPASS